MTKLVLTVPALVEQFPYVLGPANVGEILSEVYLRELLGILTGDRVSPLPMKGN